MNFTRRISAALISTGIIGVAVAGAAGATESKNCEAQGAQAFSSLAFVYGGKSYNSLSQLTGTMKVGGTLTVAAKLKDSCSDTPLVLAFHATHETGKFDPAEPQQLIGSADDFAAGIVIPASTFAGQCNVQVDFALRAEALPEVNPGARYNEPAADYDGDGNADGVGINRLISAGYATGVCALAPTTTTSTPEPTTTTSTSTPEPTTTTSTPDPTTTSTAPAPTTIVSDPTPSSTPDPTTSSTVAAPDEIVTVASDPQPTSTTVSASTSIVLAGPLPFTGDHTGLIAAGGLGVVLSGFALALGGRRLA